MLSLVSAIAVVSVSFECRMLSDQLMQLRQAGHPLGQTASFQHPPLLVLELDVVMGLGPVITQEQHPISPQS